MVIRDDPAERVDPVHQLVQGVVDCRERAVVGQPLGHPEGVHVRQVLADLRLRVRGHRRVARPVSRDDRGLVGDDAGGRVLGPGKGHRGDPDIGHRGTFRAASHKRQPVEAVVDGHQVRPDRRDVLGGLSTCDDPAAGVGAPTTPVSPFPSFHRPATPAGRPRPRLAPDADRPRVTAVYRLLAFLRAWPPLGGWGASASAGILTMAAVVALTVRLTLARGSVGRVLRFAVPGGVAGDRGAAERGSRPPGVSRLPAGESHDLRTLHPRAGRDDRDGGIRRARAVCLVDDCEVILARRATRSRVAGIPRAA